MSRSHTLFQHRKKRTRQSLASSDRLRLTVYRSNKYIYAQIIDVKQRKTLVSSSSFELKDPKPSDISLKMFHANQIGQLIAQKALKLNIKKVVFDRGAYAYHGRVKALAESARENGLEF